MMSLQHTIELLDQLQLRVEALENRISDLERIAHAPVELAPAIRAIIEELNQEKET